MRLFGDPNVDALEGKKDIAGLVRALQHKDPSIRASAVRALGGLRVRGSVGALLGALKDAEPAVRDAAVQALQARDVFGGSTPVIDAFREIASTRRIDQEKGVLSLSSYRTEILPEMIPFLIEHGADPNAVNANGVTALQKAVKDDAVESARALLEGGADPRQIEADAAGKVAWSSQALHDVAATGSPGMAQLLLDAGADVNAATSNGYTALIIAAGRGKTDVVRVLLDAGADVNARGKSGRTALELAEERGYSETANLIRHSKAT